MSTNYSPSLITICVIKSLVNYDLTKNYTKSSFAREAMDCATNNSLKVVKRMVYLGLITVDQMSYRHQIRLTDLGLRLRAVLLEVLN